MSKERQQINGGTLLHNAAFYGDEAACEQLLSMMSSDDISAVDNHGNTAFHYAALNGHGQTCDLILIKMLVESINISDNDADLYKTLNIAAAEKMKRDYKQIQYQIYLLNIKNETELAGAEIETDDL